MESILICFTNKLSAKRQELCSQPINFGIISSVNFYSQNPGSTDITEAMSIWLAHGTKYSTVVPSLMASPTFISFPQMSLMKAPGFLYIWIDSYYSHWLYLLFQPKNHPVHVKEMILSSVLLDYTIAWPKVMWTKYPSVVSRCR